MSDQYIDTDHDDYIDAPKALRDAYKKLVTDNKRLTESNSTLTGQVTAAALGGVLGEFKNPERVKSALLADKVDPLDTEAVKTWIESNGDDYAKGTAAPTPSTPNAQDPAEVAAHQQLQRSGELKQPADTNKFEAAFQEIPLNATPEQVLEIFKSKGL